MAVASRLIEPIARQQRQRCAGWNNTSAGRTPCKKLALPGLTVCSRHGASTQAALLQSQQIVDEARACLLRMLAPAIQRLQRLIDDPDPRTALSASLAVLDRVGLTPQVATQLTVAAGPGGTAFQITNGPTNPTGPDGNPLSAILERLALIASRTQSAQDIYAANPAPTSQGGTVIEADSTPTATPLEQIIDDQLNNPTRNPARRIFPHALAIAEGRPSPEYEPEPEEP